MELSAASGGGMDTLSERAAFMRDSLQNGQAITDKVLSILGSFNHYLSTLEMAIRPTQIRTHAIRKANENIDKTLKSAEIILTEFDRCLQLCFGCAYSGSADKLALANAPEEQAKTTLNPKGPDVNKKGYIKKKTCTYIVTSKDDDGD